MGNKQSGFTLIELIIVLVFIPGIIGWVWNIIKLVHVISDPLTGMTVLRGVGIIVAPLGAILGFL
jgi:competence protein ComGC